MADIKVKVAAETQQFTSALDLMRRQAHGFSEHMRDIGKKVFSGFAAERLLEKAFESVAEGVREIREFKEELEDVQASLGASADEAQRFAYAVKRADAEGGETLKGFIKLRNEARAAMSGNADAAEMFTNLGIDPKLFAAQSLTDQVLTLADAFKELSEKGAASAVALQFLEAMGAKNRSVLKLLGREREELVTDLATKSIIGSPALGSIDKAKEEKVAAEAKARAELANSGVMEGVAGWEKLGQFTKEKTMEFVGWTGRKLNAVEEAVKTISANLPAPQKPAEHKPEGHANPALTGAGTSVPIAVGAAARETMADAFHAMDFRIAQQLETDLNKRLENLRGEQQQILARATGEQDAKKAFQLLMQGKGMEGEIISLARQLSTPDSLTVKGTRISEMGGGGPVAIFGGVEVQVREQTDIQRRILERLMGVSSKFIWSGGNGSNDPADPRRAGVFPLAWITTTGNFTEKGGGF